MSSALNAPSDDLNYFRLCKLLIDYGTRALHDVLQNELLLKYPLCATNNSNDPVDFHAVLGNTQVGKTLMNLPPKVFNNGYKKLLYPQRKPSMTVKIGSFDITLTVLLLRHICSLNTKSNAWNNPQTGDNSIEALIGRLKQKRNQLAHKSNMAMTNSEFESQFCDISQTILDLSSKFSKEDLDTILYSGMNDLDKTKLMDELNKWYDDENGKVQKQLEKMDEKLDKLQEEIIEIQGRSGTDPGEQTNQS